MRPLLRCALALGLLHASTASLAAPTTAPRTLSGELQGAPWRLDVPADWNGDLVMLAHGYEPVGVPRTTPMAAGDSTAALLGAGYAVAQSAYSSQGWAVAEAITDMEHLRQHALGELKRVRHTWMLGFSRGGAVTIGSLERFPQHYAGGVSLCGANLSGEQIAADLLTTLVAFDYFFPKAEGLPVTGLASREAAMLPQSELYQGIVTALQRDPAHAALLAQRLQVSPDEVAGTISLHALVLHELAVDARLHALAGEVGQFVRRDAGLRAPGRSGAVVDRRNRRRRHLPDSRRRTRLPRFWRSRWFLQPV